MTMKAQDHLLDVVDGLYDAALDDARWPDALHGLAEFAGGCAVGFVTKDLTQKGGIVAQQYGVSDRYLDLYRQHYWRYDPLKPLIHFPAGRMVVTADFMQVDEFKDGLFYQQWAQPQGFGESINIVLDKSAGNVCLLSMVFDTDADDALAQAARQLSRVIAHARRATLLAGARAEKTAEAEAFADTMERLSTAILLTRDDGIIVHANDAARVMLGAGGSPCAIRRPAPPWHRRSSRLATARRATVRPRCLCSPTARATLPMSCHSARGRGRQDLAMHAPRRQCSSVR